MRYSCIVLIMLAFLACSNEKKEKGFDKANYEEVKENMADKEKNNPTKFLVVENRDRKNIIGQTVVKGTIHNKATIASYKDVQLKLSFFSKTAVKLDEAMETVYDNIPPGETIKFKTKYFAPKGTDSVSVKVITASGY
ncbi:MAG: FxLYD domain-containing protein [Sediminibacterium sp.]|nr:FxLYD domain-containing protein [Sediminibacterium sp.]MBX9779887.1 FxLYD domain-containing protein [Chitinophagaceae bacterium]